MSIKSRALYLTREALRSKKIIRPKKCSKCKINGFIEAHHPNYKKPLKIMWLCKKCHREWHKKHGFQYGVGQTIVVDIDKETAVKLDKLILETRRSRVGELKHLLKKHLEKR